MEQDSSSCCFSHGRSTPSEGPLLIGRFGSCAAGYKTSKIQSAVLKVQRPHMRRLPLSSLGVLGNGREVAEGSGASRVTVVQLGEQG